MENPWGNETKHFYDLTVDKVLSALEKDGVRTTQWCLPYHCMENRVYEIGIETFGPTPSPSDQFRIGKFYRPGRWSKAQIQEEHDFLKELADHEISVIAPIPFSDGNTIHTLEELGIHYCLFPKVGGRNLYDLTVENVEMLGRTIGRIHAIGSAQPAKHRIRLDPKTYGLNNVSYLLSTGFIPQHLQNQYRDVVTELCDLMEPIFKGSKFIRTHGDCHRGNILFRDEKMYFVDFDDFVSAPAIQDFWLIIPGREAEDRQMREIFIEAYEQMHSFDRSELLLIEPLRTLRLINYTSWIGKRFEDPVFSSTFPHYKDDSYWNEHIQDLVQQKQLIKSI